ncbi:hypothetical protein [Bradyrhizobium retamae]|uniref:Uncharacterized protein n=1 Tax=Bradyrhizobium retamae TaxID=1300035 RepID=A0A0R3MJD8_9BRAD|nr:hypothetical protein [Bradyrhizobium retamae]KRR20361.1 hypothetical protein CQ13_32475 [Bradyrhizobium retamae]
MPRGGRRLGAGRKPDIPPEDAALIREDCEQRARAARRKQWEASVNRELERRGVDWGRDKAARTPTELGNPDWKPERLIEYRRKYNPIVSEYGLNPEKSIPKNLPVRVEAAINAVRDNRKASGELYSTETLPRLYGRQRQKIIADVARSWGMTPRAVRTIWEAKPSV